MQYYRFFYRESISFDKMLMNWYNNKMIIISFAIKMKVCRFCIVVLDIYE